MSRGSSRDRREQEAEREPAHPVFRLVAERERIALTATSLQSLASSFADTGNNGVAERLLGHAAALLESVDEIAEIENATVDLFVADADQAHANVWATAFAVSEKYENDARRQKTKE